jgi:DNA primase
MALFGEDKIEELRARADIVEVIGAHVRLRKAGRNWVGLCPFHDEKTPSFSVNAERGFFHCFGCGAGGTVFNFLMKVEGLTFPDSVRSLAAKYGVELPEPSQGGPRPVERDSWYAANAIAAEFYAQVLWKSPEGGTVREYLKSRGITPETSHEFQVGYAPSRPASLVAVLERRGLLEAGVRNGLVKNEGGAHDMFRARVMFPIRDAQGRVIAFGGRVLEDRQPKYLNSPESPLYSKARALYGLFEARKAIAAHDRVFVVEGYFDVIALSQAGIREAVAGCGTALTVDQLRILGRHTKNVIACFDGDNAGRKASLRALEIFLEAGILGRGVFIPDGFDPDTFVREHGAAAFEDLAARAQLLVDYFLADAVAGARGGVDSRARAGERVAAMLRQVHNAFEFDLLARKAADVLGISESVLRDQARQGSVARRAASPETGAAAPARRTVADDASGKAEIGLVAMALLYPATRAAIAASRIHGEFSDRELAGALVDICAAEDRAIPIDQFIAARLSGENQERLSAAAVDNVPVETDQMIAIADNYISAIGRRQNRREHADMVRSAAEAAAGNMDEAAAAAQAAIAAIKRGART